MAALRDSLQELYREWEQNRPSRMGRGPSIESKTRRARLDVVTAASKPRLGPVLFRLSGQSCGPPPALTRLVPRTYLQVRRFSAGTVAAQMAARAALLVQVGGGAR